jgi:hypothetical protein
MRLPDADQQPTMTVEVAGRFLGLGRSAAYAAARTGVIPTLRIGRRLVVPTARLRALLGFPPDGGTAIAPSSSQQAS